MSDHNDNNKSFNLPAYLNIPFFLYHDKRLEKSALLIAAFFYSIHTSGGKMTASKDYLCELAGICKTQYFSTLKLLESIGYIRRSGFTNRKKIEWIFCPKSSIDVNECDTSPDSRTNVKTLNTSPANRTKLVRPTELILSGQPDTYNKENTKVNNKTTTTAEDHESSSSFFSLKQTKELLKLKVARDERSDEVFLEHCQSHIEKQENEYGKFQRFKGLLHILDGLFESGEIFKAKGFEEEKKKQEYENRIPTKEEFDSYVRCEPGFEWVAIWYNKQRSA